jgi:hypothetical protein
MLGLRILGTSVGWRRDVDVGKYLIKLDIHTVNPPVAACGSDGCESHDDN